MPYLTSDIVGSSSRITFGKRGDKVQIYSDHQNIYIVENAKGIRFSVLKHTLSDKKIEPDLIIQTEKVLKKK